MTAASIAGSTNWLVLVAQLPAEATARMRILRTLEALGCVLLSDGAYILPESAAARQGLGRLGEHIDASGGSHHLLHVSADAAQGRTFAGLFDRSARYVELTKNIDALRAGFGVSDPTTLSRSLIRLKRELEDLGALDFFPSETRRQAAGALAAMETEVRKLLFPGTADLTSTQELRTRQKFFRRVWVTRRPLWADRLACAWLIRRFIDAEGKVFWGERNQPAPEAAVTFGYDGAMFCNSANQVTYEVLLESFGLAKDPALRRIAAIIHALDIGGDPVPEAAGVETLLQGAQRRATGEENLLAETEKTFDLLYDAYFEAPPR
ncbi:MAG: chromate resistance protein [Burkholderiales bacterium]|nr:chromate resistance protein [Burkholderiales bacterium]